MAPSRPCPYCAAPVVVELRLRARTAFYFHPEPHCPAWVRVVYEGGFSPEEREQLARFTLEPRFETGNGAG